MQLALLGVGGAGCRVTEAIHDRSAASRAFVSGVGVFDTDAATLETLSLPEETRHLVEAGGRGTDDSDTMDGASQQISASAARTLRQQVDGSITAEADAICLVLGVGGDTAVRVIPPLAETLREVYEIPLYTVTVLPADTADIEPSVVRSTLAEVERAVDTQLVFDNERLGGGKIDERPSTPDSVAEEYADVNETIATWMAALFGAGEGDDEGQIGESVVDASEIIATLGTEGYAVVGSTSQQVREPASLLDRLLSRSESVDEIESYNTIETAVRRSLFRHRSADVDLSGTERALLVTAGPPAWLNRKAIADARGEINRETGSRLVRGGDAPDPDGTHLTVTVLCAGLGRETVLGR